MLAIGVLLLVLSLRYRPKKIAARKAKLGNKESHFTNWRNKLTKNEGSPAALIALAAGVVSVEYMTMVTYFTSIGLIAGAGFSFPKALGTFAAYCTIMILPALLLTFGRLLFHDKISPLLSRLDAWVSKYFESFLGWIFAIVGIVLIFYSIGPLIA